MCVYIYMYTHTYLYIHICACILGTGINACLQACYRTWKSLYSLLLNLSRTSFVGFQPRYFTCALFYINYSFHCFIYTYSFIWKICVYIYVCVCIEHIYIFYLASLTARPLRSCCFVEIGKKACNVKLRVFTCRDKITGNI